VSHYSIGIDLGTTHCTVAYLDLEQKEMVQLSIPQPISAGIVGEMSLLPSFLYFPLEAEKGLFDEVCIGQHARDRASEIPDRVIASAKSWLCHTGVDRRAIRLPLEGDLGMTPVEVMEALLRHLRNAWEGQVGASFGEQQILVTVPASFDPSARELVLEAAQRADYPEIVLMEEPQAAFYSWLHQHADEWRELLKVGDLILVVDIGGGTTDLSLIEVAEKEGDLTLERVAVGDHLLLGGDNMDLALAHLAAHKLGVEIDDWQMSRLVHACRQVKEQLLSEEAPEAASVTIQGRGSGLIGGSLTTELTRQEVIEMIVEGFFPLVDANERVRSANQSGLKRVGLPYATDPRISAHLAHFLSREGERLRPTALLFNGGVLKPALLRQRLVDQLSLWSSQEVVELPGVDLDCAVSRGAAYYGLARSGEAVRIRSGTSHSYFIGVEEAIPAVPGLPTPMRAICVAPFGMEEGSEMVLESEEFSLLVGEPVTFRFFSSNQPTLALAGTILRRWKGVLTELPPIETSLERGEEGERSVVVTIRARVTELGLLELSCCSRDGREWKFSFNTRDERELSEPPAASVNGGSQGHLLDSVTERPESLVH
jgi:molecular chaperone DnaK (HSP70)